MSDLQLAKIFDVATHFYHIAHPLTLSQDEKEGKEVELWDRVAGVVLFILMTPLIVPPCLYLYWASKKVDQIQQEERGDAQQKIEKLASLSLFSKDENKERNQTESDKELVETLLAFKNEKNLGKIQSHINNLKAKGLYNNEVKELFKNEANGEYKAIKERFLQEIETEEEKRERVFLETSLLYDLTCEFPFLSNVGKLVKSGANLNVAIDDKGNTVLHLVKTAEAALALIEAGAVFKENNNGENPLHTCKRKTVMQVYIDKGLIIKNYEAKNKKGEIPLLALLNRLKDLTKRKLSDGFQYREILNKDIEEVKETIELIGIQTLVSQEIIKTTPFLYLLVEIGLPDWLDIFLVKEIGDVSRLVLDEAGETFFENPLQLSVERLINLRKIKSEEINRERLGLKPNFERLKILDEEIKKQELILNKMIAFGIPRDWQLKSYCLQKNVQKFVHHSLVEAREAELLQLILNKTKALINESNWKKYQVENLTDKGVINPFIYSIQKFKKYKGISQEVLGVQKQIITAFLDYGVDLNTCPKLLLSSEASVIRSSALVQAVEADDKDLVEKFFDYRDVSGFQFARFFDLWGNIPLVVENIVGAFGLALDEWIYEVDDVWSSDEEEDDDDDDVYAQRLAVRESIILLFLEKAKEREDEGCMVKVFIQKLSNGSFYSAKKDDPVWKEYLR